jgi:hypothetical protein
LNATQETVYASDGFTVIGTKYRLDISGVVTAPTEQEFQQVIFTLRSILNQPRGQLQVAWSPDNATWYSLYSFDRDDNWGPKPISLHTTDYLGGKSALYRWQVEIETKECFVACNVNPTSKLAKSVMALTRRYSHQVSASGLTTRTISGQLTVSALDPDADRYREIVDPGTPANFVRDHATFDRTEDGRHIHYSIVDREVMHTGPVGIVSPQATFTVKQQYAGGLASCSLSGSFEGPPSVSKSDMLLKAGDLLLSRLGAQSFEDKSILWDMKEVSESVYDNSITFSFQWRTSNAQALLDGFGSVPPGSNGKSTRIGVYGGDGKNTSGIIAAPATTYDSCRDTLSTAGTGTIGSSPGGGVVITPTAPPRTPSPPTTSDGLPPNNSRYSSDHLQIPYLAYQDILSYEINHGIAVFHPMLLGADPIVQRARNVTGKVIQAGFLSRATDIGTMPAPAPPFFSQPSTEAILLRESIAPQSPEPLAAANQVQATIHWLYEFQLLKTPKKAEDLNLKYPRDARLADDPGAMPSFGLVIPPS